MKRVMLAVFAVALAACASEPQGMSLNEGLASLVGRPSGEAIARFGNPNTMHPQGPLTLYTWTARQDPAAPETGPRSQANEKGARDAALIRQNPSAVKPPRTCTLQLTIDASGRVQSWRLSGDEARCDPFARAFVPPKR
jgi:hypothetical protein